MNILDFFFEKAKRTNRFEQLGELDERCEKLKRLHETVMKDGFEGKVSTLHFGHGIDQITMTARSESGEWLYEMAYERGVYFRVSREKL